MADLNEIAESLSSLTVMEAAELATLLEEKWGVSAAAPVAVAAAGGAAAGAPVEEQTEFNAVLISFGDKKIQVIKEVRAITGLGLKEAKELVEGAPATLKEGLSKDEAAGIKTKIEEAGGQCDVK
jgi:large subunit ribosomal protein L7/L12